jgi:UDP-glucose/iron transport system ATP-binding protein
VISEARAEALLSRVGLSGYAHRDVATLSGGEAQRVSLARALANSPLVLLLDEPTSALDDEAKSQVEALIREIIHDVGLTCVVVTHDLAQAARMATRVLMLQGGRAIRIGPVAEMLHA